MPGWQLTLVAKNLLKQIEFEQCTLTQFRVLKIDRAGDLNLRIVSIKMRHPGLDGLKLLTLSPESVRQTRKACTPPDTHCDSSELQPSHLRISCPGGRFPLHPYGV